jgi:hypothetical protein
MARDHHGGKFVSRLTFLRDGRDEEEISAPKVKDRYRMGRANETVAKGFWFMDMDTCV